MKKVFGSRQFRFASIFQMCRFNSKVVQDAIVDYCICELYDVINEEFRLGLTLNKLAKWAPYIILAVFRLSVRWHWQNGSKDAGEGDRCVSSRAWGATVPWPSQGEAQSSGSMLSGSFSELANTLDSSFILAKSQKEQLITSSIHHFLF